MPAPVIQADELAKSYGGRHLFDGALFQVEEGDVVAVVGPNGAGKSTLLRILAGKERSDHGSLRVREGVRSHFFEQHPTVPEGATIQDLLATPLPTPTHLAEEHAQLEARIADPALYEESGFEAVLERFAELEREIKRATSPPPDALDSPLFRALGFKLDDLDRDAGSLSGGEKTRLFLARTLGQVRDGDLVVLDEPTNHLDVDTIEWLEEWIEAFTGTVLVVAHDRVFLDNIATRVFEVASGRITLYPGNYSDYVTLRDEQNETKRREHEKALAELKRTESTIAQFKHQKRFDGQYASRMKMVERNRQKLERTPDPVLQQVGFGLSFEGAEKSSNEMVRMEGVSKSFGDKVVLKDVHFELNKGDRVGLVGPNGAGKSTLIRMLTGTERWDAGKVHAAPGVKGTVVTQEQEGLEAERTLREEVLDARPTLDDDGVKALLGRFAFDPDTDMVRKVSSLSGGERQRLAMLKAIMKPGNLLVLDEPTNHLDLDAREIVARALNTYPGTILVVSHDRFLLDSVTDSTAVVVHGGVHVFPGTFSATRAMHPTKKQSIVVRRDRYVVKKKFDDWNANKRYRYGEEHRFAAKEIEENHALRNAVKMGWLKRA